MGHCLTLVFARKGGTFLYSRSSLLRCYPWIQGEKDLGKEVDVQLAFAAFSTSRPELEPLLNEWVTRRPKSYPAQLAAGEYFNHLGWQKRGYKWAQDTSEEQFKQMNTAFAQSIRYVGDALSLHPALIHGNGNACRIYDREHGRAGASK